MNSHWGDTKLRLGLWLLIAVGLVACSRHVNGIPVVRVQLSMLAAACLQYQADYGRYPRVDSVDDLQDSRLVLQVLVGSDGEMVERFNPTKTAYLRPGTTLLVDEGVPLDPWGNPYQFAFAKSPEDHVTVNGKQLHTEYLIWSYGENGINEWGEGDDVSVGDATWEH